MGISLIALFTSMGGFAKGIVFALAIMSVYSLTVMVGKWWTLRKAQAETRKFAPEFSQFLEEDNLNEAIRLAESYKKSHVARVLGGALGEVKPLLQDGSVTVADINSAERAVERNMMIDSLRAEARSGRARDGRCHGAVRRTARHDDGNRERVHGMAQSGAGGMGAISAGVAEALITTAFGLLVAIPAVWAYNYFTDEDRQPLRRDDVHLEGNDRLSDQGRRWRVRPFALHP